MHLFINWNIDPILFELGPLSMRWYGLLFGMAFLAGYYLIRFMLKKEGVGTEDPDKFLIWVAAGTFIGARLGHCLFYDPGYYLSHPLDIIKIWEGGLASHGAAIGIITGVLLYSRFVSKKSFLWNMDRLVIVVALAASMIRVGNLMNSEIVGSPTHSSFGFLFQRNVGPDQFAPEFYADSYGTQIVVHFNPSEDVQSLNWKLKRKVSPSMEASSYELLTTFSSGQSQYAFNDTDPGEYPVEYALFNTFNDQQHYLKIHFLPRHPSQLYEALAYLLIFGFLMFYFLKNAGSLKDGIIFGAFLITAFGARLLLEFIKKEQVAFEQGMALNMGQILSIPFIIGGIVLIIMAMKKKEEKA